MDRPYIVRQLLDMAGEPLDQASAERVIARYVDDLDLRRDLLALIVGGLGTVVAP